MTVISLDSCLIRERKNKNAREKCAREVSTHLLPLLVHCTYILQYNHHQDTTHSSFITQQENHERSTIYNAKSSNS
jgi:hypothetical protein